MAFLTATVKKDIFLPRVTMNIDIHNYLLFFVATTNQFFHMNYLRLTVLFATSPFPIQITSISTKPIITFKNTIWV